VGKFRSTSRVRSAEVLQIFMVEKNILHTINRGKSNCIGHILRRHCLLKHVSQGKIKGTGRRGRNHKHLLIIVEKKILENKGGSTKSHSLEISLQKKFQS
jgi:hypothetical protein